MNNAVLNVDCFDGFSKMNDNSVTHVFTSPPYNRKRNDKYSFYDDTLSDYKKFLTRVIDESLRVSSCYVFFNIQKNCYNKRDVFDIIGLYSALIVEVIIWNKSNPMPASGHNVTNSYEYILVLSKDGKPLKATSTYIKNAFTTPVYSNNEYTNIHKAVMHPMACEYIIQNFTNEGDLILDPFMGVGTTAVVCAKHNRNFLGFEIVKQYCDIVQKRISNLK